jgi:hypothetical protein
MLNEIITDSKIQFFYDLEKSFRNHLYQKRKIKEWVWKVRIKRKSLEMCNISTNIRESTLSILWQGKQICRAKANERAGWWYCEF